ncbi:MAG: saccharopine dehydrogenase NADP-binding domain-containing protein [Vicinamibacteria bacterium]|nr:saccharopine dehydrogenase NADP-binding domain-containing protein [Vicinamibacteria bacterium]
MTDNRPIPKRVVVLGAGMIGSAMAQDLAAQSALEVHLADARPESLDRVQKKAVVRTHLVDLANPEALRALLKDFDLAIGALPSVLGLYSVKTSIEAGCNMVDISFMGEDARVLNELAKERGVVAVTDCGVAPGLTNMVASYAATRFDAYERLEMAVGGLPAVRTWPFHYKAGFAPWDVLEEYTRPARVVEDGRVVIKEAMSGLKLINVPGVGTVESFITDGLRSLVDTLKVPFMEERTLRWPGHTELMKVFRETGFFSLEPIDVFGQRLRPRDVTAALLFPKWTFEEGEADITVMQVRASGIKDGAPKTLTFDFVDRFDPATGLRSMSRSTGFTATAVASLILDGTFTEPGVHAPEVLGSRSGLLDRVLDYLRARGIRCEMTGRE